MVAQPPRCLRRQVTAPRPSLFRTTVTKTCEKNALPFGCIFLNEIEAGVNFCTSRNRNEQQSAFNSSYSNRVIKQNKIV